VHKFDDDDKIEDFTEHPFFKQKLNEQLENISLQVVPLYPELDPTTQTIMPYLISLKTNVPPPPQTESKIITSE
jgi:hypothetical protein